MTREEYDRECDELLREFASHYDRHDAALKHSSFKARDASEKISGFVYDNWNPDWYRR